MNEEVQASPAKFDYDTMSHFFCGKCNRQPFLPDQILRALCGYTMSSSVGYTYEGTPELEPDCVVCLDFWEGPVFPCGHNAYVIDWENL